METLTPQQLLEATRRRDAIIPRNRVSKLDIHRSFIIPAFKENMRLSAILATLKEDCNLVVTRENLRAWLNRQPEIKRRARKQPRVGKESAPASQEATSTAAS